MIERNNDNNLKNNYQSNNNENQETERFAFLKNVQSNNKKIEDNFINDDVLEKEADKKEINNKLNDFNDNEPG